MSNFGSFLKMHRNHTRTGSESKLTWTRSSWSLSNSMIVKAYSFSKSSSVARSNSEDVESFISRNNSVSSHNISIKYLFHNYEPGQILCGMWRILRFYILWNLKFYIFFLDYRLFWLLQQLLTCSTNIKAQLIHLFISWT